jgi:hypothetical protein
MITVPIAVNNDFFKRQLDLFWFNHYKIYGENVFEKAFPVVILQDKTNFDFSLDIPHILVSDWSCYFPDIKYHGGLSPLNMQIGLLEAIKYFNENEILELIDCDMFYIKQPPPITIDNDEFIVCDFYENWHLKSNEDNKHIINKFLIKNYYKYNGGFVPIIGKVKTFKKILNDWIFFHIKIFNSLTDPRLQWWAGMYAFQIACANNKIKMKNLDTCYFPNINQLNNNHYICHYSCDKIFDKSKMLVDITNFDSSNFPQDIYYNSVKDWYNNYIQKER